MASAASPFSMRSIAAATCASVSGSALGPGASGSATGAASRALASVDFRPLTSKAIKKMTPMMAIAPSPPNRRTLGFSRTTSESERRRRLAGSPSSATELTSEASGCEIIESREETREARWADVLPGFAAGTVP